MMRLAVCTWLILALVTVPSVFAQSPPPPPPPLPLQEINESIATANAGISTIGEDLSAPGGSPLLPIVDGRELWGYAKWLVSPVGAEELFGPFSPIFVSIGFYLTVSIVLAGIYMTVLTGSIVIRFIIGVYRLAAENIVGTIIFVVIIAIGIAVAWISGHLQEVQAWLDNALAWLHGAVESIKNFLHIS